MNNNYVFKCSMCGGNLEVKEGSLYAVCGFCGTRQMVMPENSGNTLENKLPDNIQPLLERVKLFLEDGDFQAADKYCENILDMDPHNAEAYLGKMMADLKVRKKSDLKELKEPFDVNSSYQKIIRFGNPQLIAELKEYLVDIRDRKERERCDGVYTDAVRKMHEARNESDYRKTAALFRSIGNWKDSAEKAASCENEITAIHKRNEERALRLETEKAAAAKKKRKNILILALIIILIAGCMIVYIKILRPKLIYDNAVQLMESEKYEEAIAEFESVKGLYDSAGQIKLCKAAIEDRDKGSIYEKGVMLYESGDYEGALQEFQQIRGYKDSSTMISSCRTEISKNSPESAESSEDEQKDVEKHEDSEDKANELRFDKERQQLSTAEEGDTIIFGIYEQDGITKNGSEDIEWLVLKKEGSRILVISSYVIEHLEEKYSGSYTVWEKSPVRNWLNNVFLNKAFSEEERSMIETSSVAADANPEYDSDQGNDTEDMIFLLSASEAEQYFADNVSRKCSSTVYADRAGSMVYSKDNICSWTLRTAGLSDGVTTEVGDSGEINYMGHYLYLTGADIRPAMWIKTAH